MPTDSNTNDTTRYPVYTSKAEMMNAIYDAIGVRMRSLPATPEKILAALAQKQAPHARQTPPITETTESN